MSPPVRVRFAPSPTGNLHIGGARTALFNWALARHTRGTFVLRIEDTDPERSTAAFEAAILDGLRWLGIDWDEGPDVGGPYAPYHQAQRIAIHLERARQLLERGAAYRCFCSRERLEELSSGQKARKERVAYDRRCRALDPAGARARAEAGEAHVVRCAIPAGETRVQDLVRGEVVFANQEVEDWVMVRSDGTPTYNFVVVCDDIDMRITHVLRGEEHLVNTPKQVLLYQAFGAAQPEFGHLPLMLGTDRAKLSKRTGDTALQEYRDKGFPREATVNFLCLQGWALDGATEIFSVDDLVRNFEVRDVNKAGAIFDIEKFLWMSGEYIRRDSAENVARHCAPFVARAGLAGETELAARWEWFVAVVKGEQERIRVYGDLPARIAHLFQADEAVVYEDEAEAAARKHPARVETLRAYLEWLRPRVQDGVDPAGVREATKAWVKERGLKMPALFQPLRCALTGQASGADLFDVMSWLGPRSTVRRLEIGLERLAG